MFADHSDTDDTVEECLRVPSSIYNKIRNSLTEGEYQNFLFKLMDRPDAPDARSLCNLIDGVIGSISTREELASKIPLISAVFRVYGVNTYSRNGINTFVVNEQQRHSVQLQCRCRECTFKVSMIFKFNGTEGRLIADINSSKSNFHHCSHDNSDDWAREIKEVKQKLAGMQCYLSTPSFSASQALSNADNGEHKSYKAKTIHAVRRSAAEVCKQENGREAIETFFLRNNFTYSFIGDNESICWASPKMKRAAST
jgi:hypothetical protein